MAFCDEHSLYKDMNNNESSVTCGYYVDINIPFDSTDYEYTVEKKYHQHPGLLARALYGDERFSWVFTYFNRTLINNPIFDLVEGITIVIPTKERLLKYF